MEISLVEIGTLTTLAIFAGGLNAISGGAGMIVVPIMLMTGLPPINAVATNKFQNTLGSCIATLQYFRKGFVDLQSNGMVILYALVGACLGAGLLHWSASSGILEQVIPYLLIMIALYIAFSPKASMKVRSPKLPIKVFNPIIGTGLGTYGGFFGLGTGAFIVMAYSILQGYDIRKAMTNSKPVVLTINIASLLVLLFAGHVWWVVGICMGIGNILGAYLGATFALQTGTKLIRVLLVIIPLASAIKLLFFP